MVLTTLLNSAMFNTFSGAFLGVAFAGYFSWRNSRCVFRRTGLLLLENLLSELDYNLKQIYKARQYVMTGPTTVDHLFSPAIPCVDALIYSQWELSVSTGVLQALDPEHAAILSKANLACRTAARCIKETEQNWHRLHEWHQYDVEHDHQLLTSRTLALPQMVRENETAFNYAIQLLTDAKHRTDFLLETERGSRPPYIAFWLWLRPQPHFKNPK